MVAVRKRPRWHASITEDRLMEMVGRRMISLDNPGVCRACGADAEGCEPDAAYYECEACGAAEVFGAEEAMTMMAVGG
jgi:hypothetical protein